MYIIQNRRTGMHSLSDIVDTSTDKPICEASLKAVESYLASRVYQTALFFEVLEDLGLTNGNGHHKAQQLAALAQEELTKAWRS